MKNAREILQEHSWLNVLVNMNILAMGIESNCKRSNVKDVNNYKYIKMKKFGWRKRNIVILLQVFQRMDRNYMVF